MVNYCVDELAKGLNDFNGPSQFSINHYKYIAWDGLRAYSSILDAQANANFKRLHDTMIAQTKRSCE